MNKRKQQKTGIYKITNLINGKMYIGQSVDIYKRWKKHKTECLNKKSKSYNYPIYRAFRKYGIENFNFEILEECALNELNTRERYYIVMFNTFFKGYNQTFGGDGGCFSKIPKENIIGIFDDLETTNLTQKEIAHNRCVSKRLVEEINSGRSWYQENKEYPIRKRISQKKRNYCSSCGKEISINATYCRNCYCIEKQKYIKVDEYKKQEKEKIDRPTKNELLELILNHPMIAIGKIYNVSDNTIRKWCKAYGLPFKKTEIDKFRKECFS